MYRENFIKEYLEYINFGGIVSPMNTESCRKYIQKKTGEIVTHEDVLWLFYNVKKGNRDAECN